MLQLQEKVETSEDLEVTFLDCGVTGGEPQIKMGRVQITKPTQTYGKRL